MNKKVKLFYKRFERHQEQNTDYSFKMYSKSITQILTEFVWKQGIDMPEINNEGKLLFGDLKVGINAIVKDLELNVPKGKFFDYVDYAIENENENYLLNYEEFLKWKS